ncbi:MAG: DUF3053 family protein [Alphaproteobacteria bacterium]|nr:DUF3053 family protein [Alphaproteobacteria bacterium]
MRLVGPAIRGTVAASLALLLIGCRDEAAERKAFIGFLQTRILDKPGLHVPHLTPEETQAFGDYARHYAIITDFNDGLDRAVAKPMQEAIDRGAVRSIDDVVSRHGDFIAARDGIAKLDGLVDKQLAAADAAHAAVKQPPDLKTVFDEAYERDVTLPAKAYEDMSPDLTQALSAIVDLGDFLQQHKDKVKSTGTTIQATDPALQPQLAALIKAVTARNEALTRAQQHLRDIMNGV